MEKQWLSPGELKGSPVIFSDVLSLFFIAIFPFYDERAL